MKNILLLVVFLLSIIPEMTLAGGMNDDPLLAMVLVNQFEVHSVDGSDPVVWDGEAWFGRDLDKLWIKTDGEYRDSRVEEMELQVLYSRAIAPFWDLQAGWRRDIRPEPDRDWLVLGVKGVAPYFFDIDAAVFIGDSGRTAARFQAEYEIMFTQQLILSPELELNFHGKDDEATGIGSGLSTVEAGMRLRYEIRRQLAPYIGINWVKKYGQTADYASAEGVDTEDFQLLVGIRVWW